VVNYKEYKTLDNELILQVGAWMKKIYTPSPTARAIAKLPLCDRTCLRYLYYLLYLFLLLLPFHEYYRNKFNFTQWDLLLFTGVVTFIVGLKLGGCVNERFDWTVDRLFARGCLKVEGEDKSQFIVQLESNALHWARVGGIAAGISILGAFAIVLSQDFFWPRALLGICEAIGAYIAGTYLGRMACYGQLSRQLKRQSVEVVVQPMHVDGVAGLKPVGDFYFYQAMVVAIPAIFLAVWWFLFPIWPRDYSHWEDAYLVLLSAAIIVEILTFFIPIWGFHLIMVQAKANWLEEADRLSTEISQLRKYEDTERGDDFRKSTAALIEDKTDCYWAIENMPTWPVDIKTKKQFKLNNILLFLPLLGDIAKRSIAWKDVLELLKKLT
jgi:hypothetical protein